MKTCLDCQLLSHFTACYTRVEVAKSGGLTRCLLPNDEVYVYDEREE
jgi:hypothetical protein